MGRDVVVVGGGNVAYDVARTVVRQIAYDAARTAARLPGTSRVRLVSLEGLEDMPADTVEIVEGDEEGVERWNGWGPVEIVRGEDGRVTGVAVRRCLRVYDESRRFAPVFDDADRQLIPCDTVLLAVGQSPVTGFLAHGGEDVEMARPGWPRSRSRDAGNERRRRLRRRRPGPRHPPAHRCGGVRQGSGTVGLHLRHRPCPARLGPHAAPAAAGLSTGAGLRVDSASAGAHARTRRAPDPSRRAGRTRLRARAGHARGAAMSRLRRDAGVRRQPLRAVRRLRRRLPDELSQDRIARRHGAERRPRARHRRSTRRRHRPRRELRHSQGRRPLHPVRAVRDALSGRLRSTWSACRSPRAGGRHDRCSWSQPVAPRSGADAPPRLARACCRCGRWRRRCSSPHWACCGCRRAAVLPSPSKKFRVTIPETLPAGDGVRAARALGGRVPR